VSYTLLGPDGRPQPSAVKGQWGGHSGSKIYGRLDCPAALRALARGGYARHRVFFADEVTAVAAGYRPCATCCRDRYDAWKAWYDDKATQLQQAKDEAAAARKKLTEEGQ